MPTKLQLLHISDLHIRVDQEFDRFLILDPLLRRLKKDRENGLVLELVVVTGDIAYSGLQAEYEEANKFFTDLLATLNLPSERLFLVPGNHDVNRKAYRPRDIPVYDDMAELNAELEHTDYRADLFKGMADYFAFVNKHYPHLTSKHDDLVPFVSSYRSQSGKNIGLVGLNSAWMCRKSPDREEVAIGEYQVKNAMNELCGQGEHDLALILFHHPLDWLWTRDREICKSNYFNNKILLAGHLHDAEGVYTMGLSGAFYQFQAGGTYIGSESAWPSRYHYLTIDWEAHQIQLDFRKFSKDGRRWVLDGDKGKDGVAVFPLPIKQEAKESHSTPPEKAVESFSSVSFSVDDGVENIPERHGEVGAMNERPYFSSIYVSYAWEVEKQNQLVDHIQRVFESEDITLIRDNKRIAYKESIKEYMRELGKGGAVVIILSDEYLQSPYCMSELLNIHENKEFRQRVFPIVLRDVKIYKAVDRLKHIKFWESEIKELERELRGVGPEHLTSIYDELNLFNDIRRSIDKLMDILSDINTLSQNIHIETDFRELIASIREQIKKNGQQGVHSELVQEQVGKSDHDVISDDKGGNQKSSESIERARKKFFKKIVRKISKILGVDFMEHLRAELHKQLGEGVPKSAGSIARALCEQQPEPAIETLYEATKECLEEVEHPDDAQKVAKNVLDIFGWLILLSVSDEWVLNNKEFFLKKDEMEMKVSISTEAALEVVLSRLNEQTANFPLESIDSGDIDIKGRNHVDCLMPETGFSLEYRVLQFIEKIYTVVYRKTPGDNASSHDVVRELNKYMSLSRKHKNQIYYITIPREEGIECHDEVTAICQALRERLPALWFVHIGVRGGDEILLIYEYDLRALIRMFLELIKEYI